MKWIQSFGVVQRAGVEGTGTYGAGLARFLIEQGIEVLEINRPDRSMRRFKGKSDPTDAESAARTQTINQLRGLLISAPEKVRSKLWKTKPADCVASCAHLRTLGQTKGLIILATTLRLLAKRWLYLSEELKELDKTLEHLTAQAAKRTRQQLGVGPQTAAILLAVAGDNPERLRSEAALASLCGVNPLEASSGKTVRHRLNRGGNRAANNALWTIAMVRMRSDPRTRAYVARRTAEGKSPKEIHRCLKRYIVRELYPLILADLNDSVLAV